jgi:NADH-quinone oxidoreductase subunit E
MKRYDLRHLHDDFYERMVELIEKGLKVGEVGIFLFEVGDFSSIQKSADVVKAAGHDLMNSLKFNEVDWTIVVKKVDETIRKERAEKIALEQEAAEQAAREAEEAAAKAEAEKRAAAEAKAKEEAEKKAAEEAAQAKAEADKAVKPAPKKQPLKGNASKKPAARKTKAK